MISQQRRIDDTVDPWAAARSGRGSGAGSLLLATLLGVGIGLLAAPQPGSKTRKLLRKRLAALSEGVGESLEDVQEVSSKARKRARERLAKLREDAGDEWEEVGERWQKAKSRIRDRDFGDSDDSGSFGSLLAIAAGVAATYFLTSDRAAPVRSRVQGAATDVKRRAADQWDRFQRGGIRKGRKASEAEERGSETRATPMPSDEAPQAS
ncbi:MAG TPA: YtxH domain-containing protein [Gemmatimonadales bacterium]